MAKTPDLSVLDLLDLPVSFDQEREREVNEKLVCLMVAMGEPSDAVASKLNLRPQFVEGLIKSDKGVETVIRLQSSLFPDPQVRIKRLANLAVDVKTKLMLTAKSEQVRNNAASDFLDRAGGKAIQRVENVNADLDGLTPASLDRAIAAQQEKLNKLEDIERRLQRAQPVDLAPAR